MRKAILITGLTIIAGFTSIKVTGQNDDLKYRPFQVTFISPIGTNGANSGDYVNELSLNILGGYNGGLDGFELGSLVNILRKDMDGFQGAGFANLVGGKADGAQISGFLNIVNEHSEGMQLGGFANINGSGFDGLQGAGFLNITGGNSEVIEIGGFGNLNAGDIEGAQLAGFINLAESVNGAQLGGFINIADKVDGAQIAGFINIADKAEGIQLSVINICDSIDGIPIGFLSFVKKNGYKTWEFWGSDAMHMNLAYKLGVKHFYNIFAVGGHFTSGFNFGYGYGVGSQFNITDGSNISIDLIHWDIRPNWFSWNYNSLSQARINFSMEYNETNSFFVGPTFNVLITDVLHSSNKLDRFAPYVFYNRTTRNNYNVKMWVGINGGIRF